MHFSLNSEHKLGCSFISTAFYCMPIWLSEIMDNELGLLSLVLATDWPMLLRDKEDKTKRCLYQPMTKSQVNSTRCCFSGTPQCPCDFEGADSRFWFSRASFDNGLVAIGRVDWRLRDGSGALTTHKCNYGPISCRNKQLDSKFA